MRGKFMRGLAAGAILGAAAGMLLIPGMDRRNRRRITRASRAISGFTGDLWDGLKDFRK